MNKNQARVGFGIIILNSKKQILLGQRHADPIKADSKLHGEGTWTCPGGKLEFQETFANGVKREVKEETNLHIKKMKFISLTNDIVHDAHFVTIGFLCDKYSGKLKAMEPDEITKWKWFDLDKLPSSLFKPSNKLIKNFRDKIIFRE